MKKFSGDEIRSFLRSVDGHAGRPCRLVVIGGAAAALSFRAEGGTFDIDTANDVDVLEEASRTARQETGLDIPLGMASVFEAPYEYESRLRKASLRGLRRLTVLVPEKHDWAFMKMVRLLDKDIEHIKAVSAGVGFDKKVFQERFLSEMTHIEPQKRLVQDFLAMMEELYGEEEGNRMEIAIKAHRHWKGA